MNKDESLTSNRHSDRIVIPVATALTTAISLGIFAISFSLEAGIGWIIALFVILLIVQRIDRSRPYRSSIRVGMTLGVGVSYGIVWLFWL